VAQGLGTIPLTLLSGDYKWERGRRGGRDRINPILMLRKGERKKDQCAHRPTRPLFSHHHHTQAYHRGGKRKKREGDEGMGPLLLFPPSCTRWGEEENEAMVSFVYGLFAGGKEEKRGSAATP